VDVCIGTLRASSPAQVSALASSIEQQLASLLAGRRAAAGPGGDIARTIQAALRDRGVGEGRR
jgi:hypothetical protein